MINSIKRINSIEDVLFDNDLVELLKRNNREEIEAFVLLCPEKESLIRQAIVLLQHVNIKMAEIPDEQIEEDWSQLITEIEFKKRSKRNLKLYLWGSVACAVAVLLIFFAPVSVNKDTEEIVDMYSLVEAANINSDEVQIIAGKTQANINNNETIVQTEDGNIIVGSDRKLESTDIKTEYLTVIVPKGRRTTIKFSDGTTAWINSGSKVVYPKVFTQRNREIIVDGEMYLDVIKDENRPFIVNTMKGFEIKVLGTKFNICAYGNDSESSVVLVNGSVEITAGNSKGTLLPNQGFFAKEDGTCSIRNVDTYPYTCWIDGIMKLEGEPLGVIFKRLSRHYGLEIRANNRFMNEKYKGKLDIKEPIETVLSNIAVSTPMNYSQSGDVITLN